MTIQLIGAGVGRTGTHALKLALERLLDGTCHHMAEVHQHPEERPVWAAAMRGDTPDWYRFLGGYRAIVDFPGCVMWPELAEAYPDAPVLLSTRSSAEVWWESADATIFEVTRQMMSGEGETEGREMITAMFQERFASGWDDRDAAIAAYEVHNAAVRAAIPAERLFEYRPGDGWGPLCAALGLDEPGEPFPLTNTRDEFRSRMARRRP
jgi:hypothetical protein